MIIIKVYSQNIKYKTFFSIVKKYCLELINKENKYDDELSMMDQNYYTNIYIKKKRKKHERVEKRL